ncbi:hypothetical protein PF005_g14888 [Phytophthora fragariae]|uniref:OTU domain-containing protein n=1 Tax=Phytophthora fragariae TaxID=53985 RepID=A0A6A3XFH1_9STRA|nr:hypothetical protein PF005_g14888 [Phytophthora fragariae]KAE9236139.1 hypothetical protein PF002_g11315 [Phytophthora fragariae]
MLDDEESVLSGYVGSSAPSCTPSPAPSLDSTRFPYSLASTQASQPTNMPLGSNPEPEQEASRHDGCPRRATERDLTAGPTLSQDDFSIEKTERAPGMPQQLPVFLIPFSGALTEVPANGQCAYAALYASATATTEPRLEFTSDVVKGINILKRSVYTLMMVNLANDIACHVIDPRRELQRLYPTQPPPTDPTVATEALFSHYAHERVRTANAHIPSAFWAGPEVLRAMAQYLREPLFVLDVDANNDAHVQRYFYKDYVMPNGDIHETGCGGAMTDAEAKAMLTQYASLHVMPVFMVLKKHEGHFYGVRHGDVSTKWHAEGDASFTRNHCEGHDWYEEVLTHIKYGQRNAASVDPLQSDDATNMVIIGAMERRDRLDVVHDRLRLPRLDRVPYDVTILANGLEAEADRLRQVAGLSGNRLLTAETAPESGQDVSTGTRAPITSYGRAEQPTMLRILDSIRLEPEILADRSKLRQLLKENDVAITAWKRRTQPGHSPPGGHSSQGEFDTMFKWLLARRDQLHDMFAFLPYPELAAKRVPTELLLRWGALEAYDMQVSTLRGLLADDTASPSTKEYCRTWLAAATTEGGSQRDRDSIAPPQTAPNL